MAVGDKDEKIGWGGWEETEGRTEQVLLWKKNERERRKERREQNTEGQRKGGGRKGKVSGLGKKGRRKQGE